MTVLARLVPLLLVSSAPAQVCVHDRADVSLGNANLVGLSSYVPESLVVQSGRAMAGRHRDSATGHQVAGKVKLLERQNGAWILTGTLVSPGVCTGETFGRALALDGSTLAVGTGQGVSVAGGNPPACTHAGVVYLFDASGATPVHQQTLAGGPTSFSFGESLALWGDVLVVGDPKDVATGSETGRAYVYRRAAGSWALEQELFLPVPVSGDEFGSVVAVWGDTLAVGAPGYAPPTGSGAIFTYAWNGNVWAAEDVVLPQIPGEHLGGRVALQGDRLVATGGGTRLVSYVRVGSSWLPTQVFDAQCSVPDAINESTLSIELDENRLLVGCKTNLLNTGFLDVGYAQLWQLDLSSWRLVHEWPPDQPWEFSDYGSAVGLDGADVLIRELNSVTDPAGDKIHSARIAPCRYGERARGR